jgi:uncharacterized membrane protein
VSYPKPLFTIIFLIICFLGLLATIFPNSCNTILQLKSIRASPNNAENKIKGHHPSCEEFKSHTFTIFKRTICAGCTGLLLGALFTLTIMLFYYYEFLNFLDGPYLFGTGLVMVTASLSLIIFLKNCNNYIKILSNFLLVIGALALFLGVDIVRGDFYIELYLIILILIWIYARIYFSNQNHQQVCVSCNKFGSCNYAF